MAGSSVKPENKKINKRPTIRDVAKQASVAPATVSAILNNRKHCYASAQTRQRVRETAIRMGYRPNLFARGLNGKKTLTVGLCVADFNTEMTTRKIAAVEASARAAGYAVITICSEGTNKQEDQAVQLLLDRLVDGIAIYPIDGGDHSKLQQLVENGFPIATFDGNGLLDFPTWDVSCDSRAAGRLQVEHLIACGCKRISIVQSSPRCGMNDRKEEGMRDALAEHGLEPAPGILLNRQRPDQRVGSHISKQIHDWLSTSAGDIDGVCTIGDMIAMNIMQVAGNLGIRVPDDIAIIGHDGIAAGEVGYIPLSTVTQDSEAIGRSAFEMLQKQIESAGKSEPEQIVVQPRLIARASTVGRDNEMS